MSDLNPYEEGLALDLAKAQARIKKLEADRKKTYEALLKVTRIHDEVEARVAELEARSKEAVETLRVGFKSCDQTKQAVAIFLAIAQLEGHGE